MLSCWLRIFIFFCFSKQKLAKWEYDKGLLAFIGLQYFFNLLSYSNFSRCFKLGGSQASSPLAPAALVGGFQAFWLRDPRRGSPCRNPGAFCPRKTSLIPYRALHLRVEGPRRGLNQHEVLLGLINQLIKGTSKIAAKEGKRRACLPTLQARGLSSEGMPWVWDLQRLAPSPTTRQHRSRPPLARVVDDPVGDLLQKLIGDATNDLVHLFPKGRVCAFDAVDSVKDGEIAAASPKS